MLFKAIKVLQVAKDIAAEFATGFSRGYAKKSHLKYIENERELYVSLRAKLEVVDELIHQVSSADCKLMGEEQIRGWLECQDEIYYNLFLYKNGILNKLIKMGIEISPHKPGYLKYNNK